ncbi:MAG: histidine kinase [Gemmatimonadales bacterium]|nr:histidine kinase [Gemmatimonadales bacterium]
MRSTRPWVWLQLVIGWFPIWALFAGLIASAHPETSLASAGRAALRAIAVAALLGILVQRLTERLAWPRPIRPGFVLVHGAAAVLYAVFWMGLTSALDMLIHPGGVLIARYLPVGYLVLGVWLYLMIAGISYATLATERAARAEALAARSQLAALRSQLNPHFLFNALHTVVQLIPREPARAASAAEQLAGLLRAAVEEDRDLVSLAEEWAFVERYLDLERIRFGDRLQVDVRLSDEARGTLVPSFALQTLVENAVRHAAAPRVEPTRIEVIGKTGGKTLSLTVRDNGNGATAEQLAGNGGTGLRRLRDRLNALYGSAATLTLENAGGGFAASLEVPRAAAE